MRKTSREYDVAVVGGGIVGLATALKLAHRHPYLRLLLLEKEPQLALHQTGHNSGVVHSGIYYRPGSLKARLCVAGSRKLMDFCQSHQIPLKICGKVVIATDPEEIPLLQELYQRGSAHGVPGLSLLGPERLKELEPHAQGIQALHVPSAAVVDFTRVALTMAQILQSSGRTLKTSTRVLKVTDHQNTFLLKTTQGEFLTRTLINCAGLHADCLAKKLTSQLPVRIVPFRGEYWELLPSRRHLVRGLIYPVPDPQLPFLGVHLTSTIDGRVTVGPNAVLAFKREGYRKTDFHLRDTLEMLSFPGFWRMLRRYGRVGWKECLRSLHPPSFIRSVQRLVPAVQEGDLVPNGSGVRAQAVDRSGFLCDDFQLLQGPRILHVLNVPSPAATASLAIGEWVAETAARQFGF